MSIADDPIERQKPVADLREQARPEVEEPQDPEAAVAGTPFDGAEADPADVADQRREVPLDDDRRDDADTPEGSAADLAEDSGDAE